MNLTQNILKIILTNKSTSYKNLYANLCKKYKNKKVFNTSVRCTLSRLKKEGYLLNKNYQWTITLQGEEKIKEQKIKTLKKREIILIFDIPENIRNKRDSLRLKMIE